MQTIFIFQTYSDKNFFLFLIINNADKNATNIINIAILNLFRKGNIIS